MKKKRFIACGDPNKWSLLYSFPIFPLNGLLHCVTIKWSCYGPQSTNKIIKTPTNGPPFFATIVVPNELPSSFQSYTLTGLNTYTQYLVSLKAYNPAGDGPETIVVVMTDEGGKKLSLNKNEIIDAGDIELGSFWLNGGLLIRHHSYKCVERRAFQYIYASLKKLLAHRKYIEHVARNYSEKRSGRRRSVSRPSLFLFTTED